LKKIKISVVTGTRAEYGLLRPILFEFKKRNNVNFSLIVTGSHLSKEHGMTINEIKNDGFKIHSKFSWNTSDDSLSNSSIMLGKSIVNLTKILNKIKPDCNIVFGDRIEMLASALVATQLNIPNIHIHGGDLSGGIDEYNRHAITKLSNIHFPASKKSKERIIQMGENPKNVFLFGSTSIDDIKLTKLPPKSIIEKKYKINLSKKTIILLQHPVTTQTTLTSKHFNETLNALKKLELPTISIIPNSDPSYKDILKLSKKFSNSYHWFISLSSLPRFDFLSLVKNSGVLVGNSSSGLIEVSYFNIPVVNIGNRQKNREKSSNVIDVKNSSIQIQRAINYALTDFKPKKSRIFGNGNASKKIVNQILKTNFKKQFSEKYFFHF
jgi:UDP-hydrolysing UDP-N-acetyl-D-glucosamine 2-epimerase